MSSLYRILLEQRQANVEEILVSDVKIPYYTSGQVAIRCSQLAEKPKGVNAI